MVEIVCYIMLHDAIQKEVNMILYSAVLYSAAQYSTFLHYKRMVRYVASVLCDSSSLYSER
jgi:hypothetical protein